MNKPTKPAKAPNDSAVLAFALVLAASGFFLVLLELKFKVERTSDFISLCLVPVAAAVGYWLRKRNS